MTREIPKELTEMSEQWKQLKETIIEIRDNNKFEHEDVTLLCRFLKNYMDVLEQDANYSSIKTELKPCPFCGSKAEITRRNHDNVGYSIHVGCSKCFCKITKNLWFDFNESTIQYNIDIMTKKWNTRVEMEVQDDK